MKAYDEEIRLAAAAFLGNFYRLGSYK